MSQPKLLTVSPDLLRANGFNTNIMTPENEAKLEASIRRNGMFKPIVVRELPVLKSGNPPQCVYEVIGGEHRWQIAIKLGLEEIPVVNLGEIDDARAKEISVIDNARYGIDDTLSFAELLKEMGGSDELQEFLPYTETDFAEIFSSADISLEDLEIEENFDREAENAPEEKTPRPTKTHTIMRFKIGNRDAERITALVAQTQKAHGLTSSDELTNAGDALVELLFAGSIQAAAAAKENDLPDFDLDEVPLGDLE